MFKTVPNNQEVSPLQMPMHMGTQLMLIIKYIQKLRMLIHLLFKKLKYILNLYEEFKCIFQDIKSSTEIHPPEAVKTVQVATLFTIAILNSLRALFIFFFLNLHCVSFCCCF